MAEFSDFTKLVLDRMETNPDEFEANSRWDTLVRALEARAIGQFDDRYARTLWPLEPLEIEAIMAKYRKLYLARIHKDMLKNIVSGADKERSTQYTYDTTLPGRNSPLTASAMKSATLGMVNQAFDDSYTDAMALSTAVVKGEGMPIVGDSGTVTYKETNRYVLNSAQLAICKKLGMDPYHYAQQIEKYGL